MIELKRSSFFSQTVILTVIIVVLAGLKFIAPIIGPIFLSIFFAVIITPFLRWLTGKGLSYRISFIITLIGITALGLILIVFLFFTLTQLQAQTSSYVINVNTEYNEIANTLIRNLATNIDLLNVANIFTDGIFILLATLFLIYELPKLKSRIMGGLEYDRDFLGRIFETANAFSDYFVIRLKLNIFTGAGIAIILLLLGIDFSLFWGVLTVALSFIPYIGLLLAAIPPMLIAWVEYGVYGAVFVLIIFVIINTIAENIIFPRQAGKGLQLSIYVVFVSVFFWGWIFGGIGVFMAVPLTLILIQYLEYFEETRWLAYILKSNYKDRKPKK